MAGLFTSLLFPTQVFTASDNNLICGDENRFSHRKLNSDERDNLCESYSGKVILVVNTASRCAFTGQYEGLANLYSKYRSKGLVVVGFPSNNFGRQEPGDEQSIKNFCELTYNVEFPMYSKTRVKGENADPLYLALTSIAGPPRWNFHKYLIDREGRLVGSYTSFVKPESRTMTRAIEKLL
ncbi:MAG: glutathione peroxidase [Arenicellales bacterium]|jgi:glutathione peroxidase|nr:glutathione peroxidase [Arenicellales bacterium]MDP7522218.1 glutathione peroxidase [Arenicellales bacterium]